MNHKMFSVYQPYKVGMTSLVKKHLDKQYCTDSLHKQCADQLCKAYTSLAII